MTRTIEDDLRDYGEAFEVNGQRVEPDSVEIFADLVTYTTPEGVHTQCNRKSLVVHKAPITKGHIIYTDNDGKEYVVGRNVRLTFGDITDTSSTLDKLYPHEFKMSGSITPSPEWEKFMQTIRARAFYQWLNSQPRMRGLMMNVSFNAMYAAGVLS